MNMFWEYTVIRFKGKRYLIAKVNPKNYKIVDEDGAVYNLSRRASGITKDDNQAWDTPTAPSAPATKVDVRLNGGSDSSVKASFGLVKKVEITVNVPTN